MQICRRILILYTQIIDLQINSSKAAIGYSTYNILLPSFIYEYGMKNALEVYQLQSKYIYPVNFETLLISNKK